MSDPDHDAPDVLRCHVAKSPCGRYFGGGGLRRSPKPSRIDPESGFWPVNLAALETARTALGPEHRGPRRPPEVKHPRGQHRLVTAGARGNSPAGTAHRYKIIPARDRTLPSAESSLRRSDDNKQRQQTTATNAGRVASTTTQLLLSRDLFCGFGRYPRDIRRYRDTSSGRVSAVSGLSP